MSITAFIPVYNEELRINSTLKSLQWCDEIIVLDKESTDKTIEIANKHNARVFVQKFTDKYNANEFEYLLNNCNSEWVILFTASDVIHPQLAKNILELINSTDFAYDVIHVPFKCFVLGHADNFSPWNTKLKPLIIRKNVIQINKSGVHNAILFNSKRHYKMKESNKYCIFHLTHETVDIMMERHIRYWRGEAASETMTLKTSLKNILGSFKKVFFISKSFLHGWNGLALAFAYISYFMMSFVYKWEKEHSNAPSRYLTIREGIIKEWENKAFKTEHTQIINETTNICK